MVIVTNQGGVSLKSDSKSLKNDQKRLNEFKTKVGYVFDQLDIPISVYAATEKDQYRKPRTGIWKEIVEDYDLDVGQALQLTESIYVGDAAGRQARKDAKADHSSSDRYDTSFEPATNSWTRTYIGISQRTWGYPSRLQRSSSSKRQRFPSLEPSNHLHMSIRETLG